MKKLSPFKKNTGLLIRIDDIAAHMKWDLIQKCEILFDELNIKPLLGVIPNNKDEEFLKATGLASEEAFDAVKAIHVWNITQSAADVTMVGGEFATDAMIDHVTNQYGLDPLTAELIMPDLLITMMGDDIVKKEGYDQLKEMFSMEKYTEYSDQVKFD